MSWMRRVWNTLRPGRTERDIDRELAFHLAERIDQLRADGLSHEEASRRARIQFGNVTLQAERTRDMDVSLWVDAFLRDLRYATGSLARTPGFTIAVILTLGLGIGANSAVFSAVDAVLLRPLPFPDADRLMRLGQRQQRTAESNIAPVRLEDWNRLTVTFDGITGHYTEDVSETSGELPERVRRAFVAPRFLEVWGIAPALGRGFSGGGQSDAGGALISDRYWRVRLGADPNVLNRTIRFGTVAYPIIGVMPASFRFPDRDVDVWFQIDLNNQYAQSRLNTWYTGIGRLKPGVTLEQARSNLAAVQARLGEQYPDSDAGLGVEIAPLKETTVGRIRASLWVVFGGVSVLLLITCTNIAGLLLSRATHRRQEISIRLSLGASRVTVAMQLLVETLLLSLAGAALGLAVAAATAAGLRSLAADLPRMDEISVDWTVVVYTLATAMLVTVLCGILPAIRTGRGDVTGTLKGTTRTQVSGRHSLQWLLVGAQVTLSVVLLSAAALLVRSFQELSRVDLGFDSSRVLTFRVSGDFSETVNMQRLANRINATIDALRAVPGVDGVATSTFAPGVPSEFENAFTLLEARGDDERRLVAESRVVSPEYFATMKIPVLEGEGCGRQPVDAPRVIMVNRAFVSRYLSGWRSPMGLHLASGTNLARAGRISGVVGDARERGIDRAPAPMVYACSSAPNPTPVFLVRTHGEPMDLAQTVRLRVKELEPLRSVYNIAPLEDRIDGAFAQNRLRTVVLAVFALAALLLTCVGLYGTLNYAVSLRRREVGLRLALGALRAGIVRQFLGQGLRVVAVSCALGLGLALAFARLISGMLYGVSATDPYVLSMVVAVVLVVATLAAVVPAARASMIEPMRVLRE